MKNKEPKKGFTRETKITIISVAIAIIIVAVIIFFGVKSTKPKTDPKVDAFAQCLKDKGAIFYGAFWCSHCKNEKERFGNSENLPYVECSTPDGKSQLSICADKKIEGYPTWVFADDTRLSGDLTFEQLSEKTGCQL
jgi:hypothetical protein